MAKSKALKHRSKSSLSPAGFDFYFRDSEVAVDKICDFLQDVIVFLSECIILMEIGPSCDSCWSVTC